MRGLRFLICSVVLLGSFAVHSARADVSPAALVGRVSVTEGSVSLRPAGGEWTDSAINDPLASGISVRTGVQGRAVLRAAAHTIALAAGTELEVAQLDTSGVRLIVHRGRIGVRLSALDPARSIEVDLPRGNVRVLAPGDYDISAGDERTPARIEVFEGRAQVVGKKLDSVITSGSAGELDGSDAVTATLGGAADDEFDLWWRTAARPDADAPALHYVAAEMTGFDALDGNGSWEKIAGYGAVWFPYAVSADWVPYRHGRWRWMPPWGWTWIDEMPWGFAPSHYGRWTRIPEADPIDPSPPGAERWGWVPGTFVAHPLYAPAVVAFLGTAGIGLSYPDAVGPAIAWFPLAPGEIYWPAYTGDTDAIRRLNAGATPDLAAISPPADSGPPAAVVNAEYRNRRLATIVPRKVFTEGRPVAAAAIPLPVRRLDNAPLLAGSPQVAPPSAPATIVTAAAGVASRADAAAARVAGMVRALTRLLARNGRPATARPATPARWAAARAATLVLTRHSRWPVTRLARPPVIATAALRNQHVRLRVAAAHRPWFR